MDKLDLSIIRALQENGRLTNQELSERVGLSPSPCLRRVRLLEEAGIITGYKAQIDEVRLGYGMTIYIEICLTEHRSEVVDAFEESIRGMENVVECHLMTGAKDYLLKVLVKDLDHYNEFIRQKLQRINGVRSIDSSIVYSTVKRGTVMEPIPALKVAR